MAAPAPELTVLVLTLNEEDAIAGALQRIVPAMKAHVGDFELLVVDGGSTDRTVELARAAGARVVRQSLPGYGNAYREALALASGRWILNLDADSSHPLELFPEFWKRRESCSVVMGSRYLPGGSDTRPWGRRLMSRVLNLTYAAVLLCPLTDISGGFRLYRAEDVRKVNSRAKYYDVVAEIIALQWLAGQKIVEIPYAYVPRQEGESKAQVVRFALNYVLTLLRLRFGL